MKPDLELKHRQTFSVAQAGPWTELQQHVFRHAALGRVPGKLFLKEPLQMTALEISLGVLPPGRGMPMLHAHHENEEVYIFVRGSGQMIIDGEKIEVREGSVVRIAPNGARSWRNNGPEDLHYIVVQGKAGTLEKGTTTDGYLVEGQPDWNSEVKS